MARRSGAGRSTVATARVVQPHIPLLARADKQPKPDKRTEAALQQQARGTASNLGYHSMEIGLTRKKIKLTGDVTCPCCRNQFDATVEGYPQGWQGNTPGAPDLLFFRWQNWPKVMIPVEMKGSKETPIQPEQQMLVDAGRYPLAYSLKEAVCAIRDAEIAMDAFRMPPGRLKQIEDFLRMNEGHLW